MTKDKNMPSIELRRKPLPRRVSLRPTRETQTCEDAAPCLIVNPARSNSHSGSEEAAMLSAADATSASSLQGTESLLHTYQHREIQESGMRPTYRMDWKPFSCRWPYLSVMFVSVALLLGLVIGFRDWKTQNASKIGKAQAFAIFYLPYIYCSILSQLMQGVDIDVRALQPYVLLSRNEGASAKDTICFDYISLNSVVAMVRAIRSRHWLIVVSAAMATISSMVYPIISNLFFSLEGEGSEFALLADSRAAGAGIFFATIHLVLLALLIVQCSRADTGLRESPYSIQGLAALAREDDFRKLWARFPPWVTSATLHKNLEGLRVRIDRDASQPCFKVLSANGGNGAGAITDDNGCIPAAYAPPSGWRKLIFWTWNSRQPFVFQTAPLLILTLFLFPGVWAPLKLLFGISDIDFDVKRVIFALIGTGLKLYVERMDLEHRFVASFIPRPLGKTSSDIIAVPRSSIKTDFLATRPLVAPFTFFRTDIKFLGLSAFMPLFMELWVVTCGLNPSIITGPSGDAGEKTWLLYELSSSFGSWGFLVGFIFGLAAMQYAAQMLLKSYTPVTYPLPRRPASIAERISFIHASEGVTAVSATNDKEYTFGWYEGQDKTLQLQLDDTRQCIRTFVPGTWYASVEDAIARNSTQPRKKTREEDETQRLVHVEV